MSPRSCALAISLTAALALTPAGSESPGVCSIHGQEESFGPTYVTSLRVIHTSCKRGKQVVRAYHSCRKANGGIVRGRCTRKVLGYRCKEQRGPSNGVQISPKVTCRRGTARVIHTYSQDL
jgi:hypothetical protein